MMFTTSAIIALILSAISAAANVSRLGITLHDSKISIWGRVKKGVDEGLNDRGLITERYNASWLQRSLNILGADPVLEVDGHYQDNTENAMATRAAVKAFQRKHGLEPDGWAGLQTLVAILAAIKAQETSVQG